MTSPNVWVVPDRDLIKQRAVRRALNTHLVRLRASGWGADRVDADTIQDLITVWDSLNRGDDHWASNELLSYVRLARRQGERAEHSSGSRALLHLAQDIEDHLPTPVSISKIAEEVVEQAEQGSSETSRARHLLLWFDVLTLISEGHGNPVELAQAALGAYDTNVEFFIHDHLH